MSSHLEQRWQSWYAILNVPRDVQGILGRKRFLVSLKTRDRRVAEREAKPIVAEWQRKIAIARGEEIATDDAAYWRGALRRATDPEKKASILRQIERAADEIGMENVEIGSQPSSDPEARRFYAAATGALVAFTEHLDEWIATSRATAKTQDMQRADVKRFAAKFAHVQDVTRPEVRRWITGLMNDDGLTPKTVQRILSGLRGYWRYLQSINVAGEDDEPFAKLDVARQNKRADPRSVRQPFAPADVLALLGKSVEQEDDKLADLIRLGMWTGCRIEELCALKVDRVKAGHFSVEDAKTAAGWREVPIHAELAPTMARLVGTSRDGYVLSGLKPNKYGDRSNAVGKRFGRLKDDLKFGPQYVFHSIRKTVVTILENAGVPENVVADIVGHEKPTMTYGLYSGGVSLAVKAEALAKLFYAEAKPAAAEPAAA